MSWGYSFLDATLLERIWTITIMGIMLIILYIVQFYPKRKK